MPRAKLTNPLVKRVNKVPRKYWKCRIRGTHNPPIDIDPAHIERDGDVFRIVTFCEDCEQPIEVFRSTSDYSRAGNRRIKYDKEYHLEDTTAAEVRNAMYEIQIKTALGLQTPPREEPEIKPARRRNGKRGQ